MNVEKASPENERLVVTGVEGLDEILGGGLTPNRVYLLEGNPGSGKTTLALQCLLEGVERGEAVLYVTLSETKAELNAVARSHGWSLEGVSIVELVAQEGELEPDNQYAMFEPSEIEQGATARAILMRRTCRRSRRDRCRSRTRRRRRRIASGYRRRGACRSLRRIRHRAAQGRIPGADGIRL